MKSEAISFTPDATTKTYYFDDDTIVPKSAIFMVMKDGTNVNIGTGFASPGKNFGGAVSDNATKNSDWMGNACMIAKDGSTVKVQGVIDATGFNTAGELHFTFSAYDSTYKIFGMVFGE